MGGSLQAKYLVLCCCNRDSLKFDMQHDYVLKKWNFDLLTLSPGSGWGSGGGVGGLHANKLFGTLVLQS